MPLISKSAFFRIIPVLARYVPIVSRGLALAFFVVAASIVALSAGNFVDPVARYTIAGLLLFFGVTSLAIGHYTRPILRWLMRTLLGGGK